MYGGASEEELNEESLLDPKSLRCFKVFSHNINKIYRESYDLFCVNGILFNHESPHREKHLSLKITRVVGRIKNETQNFLTLGN